MSDALLDLPARVSPDLLARCTTMLGGVAAVVLVGMLGFAGYTLSTLASLGEDVQTLDVPAAVKPASEASTGPRVDS